MYNVIRTHTSAEGKEYTRSHCKRTHTFEEALKVLKSLDAESRNEVLKTKVADRDGWHDVYSVTVDLAI